VAKLPLALCVSQTESYFLIHSLFLYNYSTVLLSLFFFFSLASAVPRSHFRMTSWPPGPLWSGMSLKRAKFSRDLGECGRKGGREMKGGSEKAREKEKLPSQFWFIENSMHGCSRHKPPQSCPQANTK